MKNLLYTICDEEYIPLLNRWIENMREHTSAEICIITPNNLSYNSLYFVNQHRVDNFDFKFTGKFDIITYQNINHYNNILFLDLDILAKKNFDHIFTKINSNLKVIHSVREIPSILDAQEFHRCNVGTCIYPDYGYNAGTFGFNISLLPMIQKFYEFIINNKHKAICDQPLFNMFFNEKRQLDGSLSDDVFLDGYSINEKKINHYPLIHFLGSYGDINNKLNRINNYV